MHAVENVKSGKSGKGRSLTRSFPVDVDYTVIPSIASFADPAGNASFRDFPVPSDHI